MAFVDDIRRFEASLVAGMREALADARRRAVRRRVYRTTKNELGALSHRELVDLGIDRADIPAIARQAARDVA